MNDRLSRIGCRTRGKSKASSEDPDYLLPLLRRFSRADSFYSERYQCRRISRLSSPVYKDFVQIRSNVVSDLTQIRDLRSINGAEIKERGITASRSTLIAVLFNYHARFRPGNPLG